MGTPACVLYTFPPLPNPQKARLALEEFGVPYVAKDVNVMAGDTLTPDFLENINSNGTVPVLVINTDQGRKVVAESKDIVLNAFTLTRRGVISNADLVRKWVDDFDSWNGPLYTLTNDAVLKGLVLSVNSYKTQLAEARQKQYPALAEAYARSANRYRQAEEAVGDTTAVTENQKRLVALLDAAETQLSKSAFLAGDAYSAADVMLTCAVFLVDQAKQSKAMLTSRPNLLAWWKRMKTRPSFKVVFGPATSPKTMLTQVLPAVIKVMSCKVLRRY